MAYRMQANVAIEVLEAREVFEMVPMQDIRLYLFINMTFQGRHPIKPAFTPMSRQTVLQVYFHSRMALRLRFLRRTMMRNLGVLLRLTLIGSNHNDRKWGPITRQALARLRPSHLRTANFPDQQTIGWLNKNFSA